MSVKRRRASHANSERWLVSYADFMTLLFAFFVVMYAASAEDSGKVGKLAMAIQSAFKDLGIFTVPSSKIAPTTEDMPPDTVPSITDLISPTNNNILATLQKELSQALAVEIKRGKVAVSPSGEGLVITLREMGFFDSGSAEVKLKSEPTVALIAKVLESRPYRIRIEGHTDNVPIHTERFASNWELSTARSTEVTKLFITRYEFPPGRLSAAGFAEFHPVASNGTAEGRALNRRVDIIIVGPPKSDQVKSSTDEARQPAGSQLSKQGTQERRR